MVFDACSDRPDGLSLDPELGGPLARRGELNLDRLPEALQLSVIHLLISANMF